jgi:hypothetical protein
MCPTVGLPQGGMIQFIDCLIRQLQASASNVVSRQLPLRSTATITA